MPGSTFTRKFRRLRTLQAHYRIHCQGMRTRGQRSIIAAIVGDLGRFFPIDLQTRSCDLVGGSHNPKATGGGRFVPASEMPCRRLTCLQDDQKQADRETYDDQQETTALRMRAVLFIAAFCQSTAQSVNQ